MPATSSDLHELVVQARSGDGDALTALLRWTQDNMGHVAISEVGPDLADDVMQETILRIMGNLESVRDAATYPGWVRTIIRNTAVDVSRQQHRNLVGVENTLLQPDVGADVLVLDREVGSRVQTTLEGLSEGDARLLSLRHLEDRPSHEVAAILGMTAGSVRVALTRARHRFGHAWGRYATSLPVPMVWRRRWQRGIAPSSSIEWLGVGAAGVAISLVISLSMGVFGGGPPSPIVRDRDGTRSSATQALAGPQAGSDVLAGGGTSLRHGRSNTLQTSPNPSADPRRKPSRPVLDTPLTKDLITRESGIPEGMEHEFVVYGERWHSERQHTDGYSILLQRPSRVVAGWPEPGNDALLVSAAEQFADPAYQRTCDALCYPVNETE